jgi:hypothetical protein
MLRQGIAGGKQDNASGRGKARRRGSQSRMPSLFARARGREQRTLFVRRAQTREASGHISRPILTARLPLDAGAETTRSWTSCGPGSSTNSPELAPSCARQASGSDRSQRPARPWLVRPRTWSGPSRTWNRAPRLPTSTTHRCVAHLSFRSSCRTVCPVPLYSTSCHSPCLSREPSPLVSGRPRPRRRGARGCGPRAASASASRASSPAARRGGSGASPPGLLARTVEPAASAPAVCQ